MIVKKNIFILRHGHADFNAESDYQRPLTEKGRKATEKATLFISQKCKKHSLSIDHCLCSAALRTQQTAKIVQLQMKISTCDYSEDLYSTVASHWLDKLSQSKAKTLILVGHNPTLSQLVYQTTGHEFYMKPANCAFITLEFAEDGFIYPATLEDFHT